MKSVLEQYGVSTDNETAYKKVRNDVLIKLSRYDTFARWTVIMNDINIKEAVRQSQYVSH